jgi:transcriptional regulator with XRE-family HTH domain
MGIFVRQLRHLLELTQAQFAVKLGVATDSDRPLGKQSIAAFAKER